MTETPPEIRNQKSNFTLIAIAVVEHQEKFLIGRRPEGVPLAGLWEFPGGKVESGETAEEAARRECFEEAGLDVEVLSEYPPHVQDYDHGRVELRFFACRPVKSEQTPNAPFQWVPRAELSNYEFPEGNRQLLELLSKSTAPTSELRQKNREAKK